ncbi:MAG: hypothetical protein RIC19_23980 [Phaeodactylibacter sp.]|uniref:hypothetical protein n=1 Tax=Phaeodactylibacter sp. TaxID=1940289 RepID=UPI0032EF43E5
MEQLSTTIEQLLATKNYGELTPAEQDQVAASCGRSRYEQLRQSVQAGQSLSDAPAPPPALKADLMKAFRQKHQRRNIPLHSITLPFWQAAAIAACMVLLGQVVRFAPVYAQTPAIAWEGQDSLWFKKVTQIVADTARAVFSADEKIAPPSAASPALLAADADSLPSPALLPQPVSDTPGWAKRSALGTVEHPPILLMVY